MFHILVFWFGGKTFRNVVNQLRNISLTSCKRVIISNCACVRFIVTHSNEIQELCLRFSIGIRDASKFDR